MIVVFATVQMRNMPAEGGLAGTLGQIMSYT